MFRVVFRFLRRVFGHRLADLVSNDKLVETAERVVKAYAPMALKGVDKAELAVRQLVEDAQGKLGVSVDTWDARTLVNLACSKLKDELKDIEVAARVAAERAQVEVGKYADRILAEEAARLVDKQPTD